MRAILFCSWLAQYYNFQLCTSISFKLFSNSIRKISLFYPL
nr:MAG TPA: hypothetical protein [Caudoviricetes sp.]